MNDQSTPAGRAEPRDVALLHGLRDVLEMIAAGAPLADTLDRLLRAIESQAAEMLCSLLLLDTDGLHLRRSAAPSLPDDYMRVIDGEAIGPSAGSCGTAAFRRQAVLVEDITIDPLWRRYREGALRYGLRACWSTPIFDRHQTVVGTFAIYYRQPRLPTAQHLELIGIATHIAAIAIGQKLTETALRVSESRYYRLIDSNVIGVSITNDDEEITEANNAFLDIFACTRADLAAGRVRWDALIAPESVALYRRARETLRLAGACAPFEMECIRPDGRRIPVRLTMATLEGPPGSHICLIDNLTERKRAEEALRESDVRTRLLVESFDIGLWDWDLLTDAIYFSPQWKRHLGYADHELANQLGEWEPRLHPDDREATLAAVTSYREGRIEDYDVSFRLRHKDGSWRSILSRAKTIHDASGRPVRIMGCHIDVTEKQRAEEERRQVFERIADAFVALDTDWRYTFVNRKAEEIFGRSAQSLIGKHIWSESPEGLGQPFRAAYENAMRDQQPASFEGYHPPFDRWFENRIYPSSEGLTIYFRDITARKKAEANLREAQERLQMAVSAGRVGLWDWDVLADTVYFSPEWKRQIGYEADELSTRVAEWRSRVHPEDRDHALQAVRGCLSGTASAYEVEFRFRHKDGTYRHILGRGSSLRNPSGTVIGLRSSHVDITEHAELRAQFLQSQKMESVGRLAGGVAHDYNNLLTVINGLSGIVLAELPADDPLRTEMNGILQASTSAAALTRQLLAFSRRQILERRVLNLNAVISDVQSMLRRLVGEDVAVVLAPGQDLGNVRADRGQVEQILMNLSVNARDAMPNGGTLTIETRDVELDDQAVATQRATRVGPHVRLIVSDTGIGMDDATRRRIFEPFFTTKESGRGTGLGLSTVYGIVMQSDGAIDVSSTPGHGTTFTIDLPRVDEMPQTTLPVRHAPAARGTETILVVEDDKELLTLAKRVLESRGYEVLIACNAEEAQRLLGRHQGPLHLILTDVVMPGMNGRALAEWLTAKWPDVDILYTSGYTDDAILRLGVLNVETHFIAKPYEIEDLLRRVREVLDGS